MINITQDIHSLTDFKKNTNDFIFNLKKSGRPNVLTVNGKPEIVVIDANAFQKIQEQLGSEDVTLEIQNSLKNFESGKFSPAKKVLGNLRKRISNAKNK